MEKLHEYQGIAGRLHQWRDSFKETYNKFNEDYLNNFTEQIRSTVSSQLKGNAKAGSDFSHIYRKKSRAELVRVSAAVMGIEFSYAAETAFVSPTLLKIGVRHQQMTLVWALSPLVGFFVCPILGSLSDRCKLNMGRRRPFIILLSIGIVIGLILVPNGECLGYWLGDVNQYYHDSKLKNSYSHPWGIFFTILGTVLLDFDADACQSPARAYLLDVCVPEDHAKGLSTFTVMAGLGGFFGYSMSGLNWDETEIGRRLGGHVKAVFSIITVIFVTCVAVTLTSFSEIPLWLLSKSQSMIYLKDQEPSKPNSETYGTFEAKEPDSTDQQDSSGAPPHDSNEINDIIETSFTTSCKVEMANKVDGSVQEKSVEIESLHHYLLSIVNMPYSLRMICLTNLFCWMAHVCYSLYFTDFVGEAVFKGDPNAKQGSEGQLRYEEGVRFGCLGMAMYSLSCSFYSLIIDKLIARFRAKYVYVGGLIFYSIGMAFMALTRAKLSVLLFSWTAGVMYSTLFTMPYLLVAHYHHLSTFDLNENGETRSATSVRGLGTDIAIISSMVFLAQFILSLCMGTIITSSGTTTSVICTASFLSFCGALSATKIMYLEL
ncbi:membrane-associated transporter protein [Drosophila bipectinata]|uniref:membrane-associated transporter protein n=1 Tax=Drosophila bipectinata TaxID=42026 RepID=UPI001C898889|nr:proton-associated sugar transporter A [Drosophila bipectinata]